MSLNKICQKCVDDLLNGRYGKNKDVTVDCDAYRGEPWHFARMLDGYGCPFLRSLLEKKIMGEISFEAEKEIDLRREKM